MSVEGTFGRTIQLFLVDGSPTGLRKATIHGWTGVVLVAGEAAFADLTQRQEADRTGVYFLIGPDPDEAGTQRAYVGSANSVRERIRQSADKRTFWNVAVAVTTSDDDLSKGHAEYLEARLIELAAEAKRVRLDNGTQPDTRRRRLPEADRANMEQFLANLRVVLPVVGSDMLKPQPKAVQQTESPTLEPALHGVRYEVRHKSGVFAEAVEEGDEFVVLEGSEALTDTGFVQQTYGALEDQLVKDGVLAPGSNGRLRFLKPHAFSSPSAAAAVVLDRNSNGRNEWRVKGEKQTYAEHQRALAEAKAQPTA